ncbi:TIGR02444 family protein [Bradyrhizobium sp. dw_78]|uniref:TIGR02444 family protein n=1 Tax=Bradyrhizobium sp. dw_78 TaxID=2719793 RepID=UPI001BD6443B|nr:TIGR02444 family protein [Bradyrhizobium sp. dw_78]
MVESAEGQRCWQFVVELYAKPGVSQACLALQDRLGVDVSFLLTILFYAVRGGADFQADEIARLDHTISGWRNEVIRPLRALRRRLKGGDLLSQPTDEFYRRIKADELSAEQIEIGALVRQLEQRPGNPSTKTGRAVIERVARHFAEASGQAAHLNDDEIQHAISILHS